MSETPLELRDRFRNDQLGKHEYALMIGQHHRLLNDYCALLKDSAIGSIELSAEGVTFVSRVGGARFPCDPADRGLPPVVALNFEAYERKDFAMMLALMPPGATFVDIGANIGWYAVHVARADPTSRVIAAEPIPTSFNWLTTAIAANSLTNVAALNIAIGAEPGTLTLYVDSSISGAASGAPSTGREGLDRIECPVLPLDELVAANGGVADFVKLDIEGAELFALQGSVEVLGMHQPIVFCEMLRKLTRPFGYHPNAIIEFMTGFGYRCYRCEAGRLIPFATMDEETVETNFYFLHSTKHAREIARFVDSV